MPSASNQTFTPVNLLSVAVSSALFAPTTHVDKGSRQARYDSNFSAVGISGLNVLTRYISGSDAQITGSNEWDRDIELKHVVQSGPMKNLHVRLRNAPFRSDFAPNVDENRIAIGSSLAV